jgi:hypothetical protein
LILLPTRFTRELPVGANLPRLSRLYLRRLAIRALNRLLVFGGKPYRNPC